MNDDQMERHREYESDYWNHTRDQEREQRENYRVEDQDIWVEIEAQAEQNYQYMHDDL